MKRRKFLSLLGAGVAAPMMPLPSLGAATTAGYSPAAVHGAILHAQSSRYVSAWGLSKALNVAPAQASALMQHLAERGVIAPMRGARMSSQWAASRVHTPLFARQPRTKSGTKRAERHTGTPAHNSVPDIDLLMQHLRTISERYFAAKADVPA